jgi:hypothetical protein
MAIYLLRSPDIGTLLLKGPYWRARGRDAETFSVGMIETDEVSFIP